MTLLELLQHIYPDLVAIRDVVIVDYGQGQEVAEWYYSAPQPTTAELEAARPAADAAAARAADLAECDALLTERYRAFNRLNASGGSADELEAARGEIHELLTYMEGLNNAAQPA